MSYDQFTKITKLQIINIINQYTYVLFTGLNDLLFTSVYTVITIMMMMRIPSAPPTNGSMVGETFSAVKHQTDNGISII